MPRRPWRVAWLLAFLVAVAVSAQPPPRAHGWPVATPASVGLDAKVLAAFDADIRGGTYGYVDSMLVIRHGKVAYDRAYPRDYDRLYGADARQPGPLNAHDPTGPYNYFNPWWHPFYRRGALHSLQSVTKTITSVIIGAAVTRGDFPPVDTPILSFFDEKKVANVDDCKRRVTIRHLLTMTGGFDWNENLAYTDPNNAGSQMEASADWVRFTIDRPMAREPGTRFNYSSGESALLAHVFRVATKWDVEEYGATHLFAPLGIRDFFWKRGPSGLADTEGGLYLDPTRPREDHAVVPEGRDVGGSAARGRGLGQGVGDARRRHRPAGREVRVQVVAVPVRREGRAARLVRLRVRGPVPSHLPRPRHGGGVHRLEYPRRRSDPAHRHRAHAVGGAGPDSRTRKGWRPGAVSWRTPGPPRAAVPLSS